MDLQLKDKVVLVTGATGGIGTAITKAFYEEGSRLAVTGINQGELDRLMDALGNPPAEKVRGYVLDITDEQAVKTTVDQVAADFGSIYSLIACAGDNGAYETIADATRENYEHVFAVNVYGVLWSMKYTIPHLLAAGQGSIVAMGSEGSYVGSEGMSAYVASKHAVAAIIKTAGRELGAQGIHCNYIAPSAVDTDMMRRIEKNTFGDTKTPEEAERFFAEASVNKRYCKPEEVAYCALYLASEVSAHMMGWGLRLDGGKHIL